MRLDWIVNLRGPHVLKVVLAEIARGNLLYMSKEAGSTEKLND
jgi:hypothetical protein